MLMNTPIPFSPHLAMTWPIDPAGGRLPYPCQGMTHVAHRTVVTAGLTTLDNFTGSATHGGGSCQFGINLNGLPAYTADPANWRAIYIIIGGCPTQIVRDAVHCGDDEGVDCIRQYKIPIPKGLSNRDATFAWTWYNRITKDEVYMMCAPITVVGGVEDPGQGGGLSRRSCR
ncbi:lytic polysaccharide monooxygenase [Parathielavia appendiculata]|uniref:Lytic polysaccharide monooxygenase n=1 Tax=Parathielavia appendiculata TaxID=2587402 RepID=A0AAN6TWR3_9PEZI|nr:lytic polysaccharide monooxygenase [Parathielavia appendiculata]